MLSEKTQRLVDRALKAMEKETIYHRPQVDSATAARAYASLKLRGAEREKFAVMFLNSQNEIISFDVLFEGTINQAPVFPREIAKAALTHNAAAVILAHNHPSGTEEPSMADKDITELICDVLGGLDIRVLDHFIIGDNKAYSFAEHGLI